MPDTPPIVQIEPGAARYPAALSAVRKAPVLSAMGNLALLDMPGIGFCGSRKASGKGVAVAADCAAQAVDAGFTVISGNAAGVDTAAHHAALANGGTTILVLPEGITQFRVRKDLRRVWDWSRTLVLSQFAPEAIWQAYRAMERNEVIIALSRALVVIEAGSTGGTLAAGTRALEVGKPVFVADYENIEAVAPGNAELLGRGARPLRRSRETGRANVTALREIAATPGRVQMMLL
jgi:DNA processing protein